MTSGWHQVQLADGRLSRVPLRRIRKSAMTTIRDEATAGLVQCAHCDAGFCCVGGIHVGSQRLGMIPSTPCERLFAARGEGAATARPWLAYVDGAPLRKRSGEAIASPRQPLPAAQPARRRREGGIREDLARASERDEALPQNGLPLNSAHYL